MGENFYRKRILPNGFMLLTVDSGDWLILSERRFREFESGNADVLLKNILKDKGIIIEDDNREEYIRRLRERYSHLFTGPSLHIVAVTKRCNNACTYCHANAVADGDVSLDMAPDRARRTVDFIFQSPNQNISIEFQGGEPLMNWPAVQEIVTYAEEKNAALGKNLRFALVTNMTCMDAEKLAFLKAHRVGLCTSLDGPEAVHNANRTYIDGRGTYADVVRRIREIKPGYPLEALMVTTKNSLPYAKEIVDEYFQLGFDHIQLRPLLMLGAAQRHNAELSYTADEYLQFWTEAMDYILELNKQRFFSDRYASHILRKLFTRRNAQFVDLNSPCGAAISTLAYDQTGSVYSCDEGRQYDLFRLGTVDMKYGDVFESQDTQSLIRSSVNDCTLCDACVWKPFCGLCPVCSFAKTGNLIPILSRDDRCRILDGQFSYLLQKIVEDRHNETFRAWISNI
jgi:uncharacterized protein